MRRYKNTALGFSLVELLVAIALLAGILAIIFPQYVTLSKHSSVTRRMVKTQVDIHNNLEQMFKEVSLAGFGLPTSADYLSAESKNCLRTGNNAVEVSKDTNGNTELIVRSTATGDSKKAGSWASISINNNSQVILENSFITFKNDFLMVLDASGRVFRKLGLLEVDSNGSVKLIERYSSLSSLRGKIAYWIPDKDKICFETKFYLDDYNSNDPIPSVCAPNTKRLMRVSEPSNMEDETPILDCVHPEGFVVRLGCANPNGEIEWYTDGCPQSSQPKLVKIGLLVQSGVREKEQISKGEFVLFDGMTGVDGNPISKMIKITDIEGRHYRWAPVEKTIFLVNTESEG